jgi:hypothetical protein
MLKIFVLSAKILLLRRAIPIKKSIFLSFTSEKCSTSKSKISIQDPSLTGYGAQKNYVSLVIREYFMAVPSRHISFPTEVNELFTIRFAAADA